MTCEYISLEDYIIPYGDCAHHHQFADTGIYAGAVQQFYRDIEQDQVDERQRAIHDQLPLSGATVRITLECPQPVDREACQKPNPEADRISDQQFPARN